ncbi:serine-rich adhesin for platelets [Hyalella azteca]|uniref:protein-tyrosine-phosphatase n=1 Tax=Hyalella azteca TaxID=294128 RepID=A0A8B7PDJ4_HYAAZ|nr:serine-rich adhesin for platelets [Hyalella azteca]
MLQVLVVDSRTFCEYNTSHVVGAVNVWSSKIRKKRLQQNSMSVRDYVASACEGRACGPCGPWGEVVVYDLSAPSLAAVPHDSFLYVLLDKLASSYRHVQLLVGGFLGFQAAHPDCCEDAGQKCSPLTSLSQPCLPVANTGPTRVLPFLYLGSQHDANNKQMLQDHCILYEVNVSISCPKPDFVQDSHFLRIPVNDNFSEKLTPYFFDAFRFIDKVRESGGSVLVHCLAGISRSATVAIAYVMKHLHLPYEEAYRYVKNRRPTISPNINFVGQLLELDRVLRTDGALCDPSSAPASFRQPCGNMTASPYGSTITNITNPASSYTSLSLDYAINNKNYNNRSSTGGVLSDVTSSSSCYLVPTAGSALQRSDKCANVVGASDSWQSFNRSVVKSCSRTTSDLHVENSNYSVVSSVGCKFGGGSTSNVSRTLITQDEGPSKAARLTPSGAALGVLPRCPSDSAACKALRDEARLACLGCPKGAVHSGITRSLSLNLKSTLEAVPGSPGSTPQSPEYPVATNIHLSSSQSTPLPILTPESGERATHLYSPSSLSSSLSSPMSGVATPVIGPSRLTFNTMGANISPRSSFSCSDPTGTGQSLRSPTIIKVQKSPTIMENIFDRQYSAMNARNENLNSQKNIKNSQKNLYSSTATISVAGSDATDDSCRPRSVCIIEVNANPPVTYVENCSTEPMIVRETEVMATPSSMAELISFRNATAVECSNNASNNNNVYANMSCTSEPLNTDTCATNNLNCAATNKSSSSSSSSNLVQRCQGMPSLDDNDSRSSVVRHTLVPIRASSSFGSIIDRPKVLELCTPMFTRRPGAGGGPGDGGMIMGDCTWQNRSSSDLEPSDPSTAPRPEPPALPCSNDMPGDSNNNNNNTETFADQEAVVESNAETMSVTGSSEDTASEFGAVQSDSGVSFETDLYPGGTSRAIPRCYSSSETHLNTRRLLEAHGDYATRKSCSNDEVPRTWSLHRPLTTAGSNPLSVRDDTSDDQMHGVANQWHYPGELVRCDSWSTSGLGSELSDWESLQEDVNSTHCDDALGPFDAVFSDVFPGEKTDSLSSASQLYMRVFPARLFEDGAVRSPSAEERLGDDKAACPVSGPGGDRRPRHHSFKEQRGVRPQQQILLGPGKLIPLARPASLPGVMGSYLAQTRSDDDDGVELRSVSGRGRGIQRSCGSRDSGTSGCGLRGSGTPSESATGVQRNDSGYYSVGDPPASTRGDPACSAGPGMCCEAEVDSCLGKPQGPKTRQQPPNKLMLNPLQPPLPKPVPFRPPRSTGPSSLSSPTKTASSSPKAAPRRTSPTKSPSPQKTSSPTKLPHQLPPSSPTRKSSCSPPKTPASPQPRIFGASTFYLPGDFKESPPYLSPDKVSSLSPSVLSKTNVRPGALLCKNHDISNTITSFNNNSNSCDGNNMINEIKSNVFVSRVAVPERRVGKPKTILTSRSAPAFSAAKLGPRNCLGSLSGRSPKSLSPVLSCSVSPDTGSPLRDSDSRSGETTIPENSSSSSSRETSVESEASIVQTRNFAEDSISGHAWSSIPALDPAKGPEYSVKHSFANSTSSDTIVTAETSSTAPKNTESERSSPEEDRLSSSKKSRGSEEQKTKEKRRSCELDSSSSCEEQNKKPVSLRSGVRLAQELLQSMESIVTSELSEIRRCTAELSSRYGLKTRPRDLVSRTSGPTTSSSGPTMSSSGPTMGSSGPTSSSYARKVKNMSQFYVVAAGPAPEEEMGPAARCRSEPPYGTEEGLYRAQSCPGLPQPLVETRGEDQEGLGELRPTGPPLSSIMRARRHLPSKEKLLNRYSCGALDASKPPSAPFSADVAFESCPDLGTLRPSRPCTSGSSSSSVSSSRSSFSRLLPVS